MSQSAWDRISAAVGSVDGKIEVETRLESSFFLYTYMEKLRLWVIAMSWYTDRYQTFTWSDSEIVSTLEKHNIETILFSDTFHRDYCWCPSLESRLYAIEKAYSDESLDGILSYLWWRNSIHLLPHLPYHLIKDRNIPLIGYSDITVLLNAIYNKTWVTWIHWPLFVDHWTPQWNTYIETLKYLLSNRDESQAYTQKQSYNEHMRRMKWKQGDSIPHEQKKRNRIRKGEWKGVLVWWNLISFVALCGTEYFPDLTWKIICIEDDECENIWSIDRALHTLSLQPWFSSIRWIIIWSFHLSTWLDQNTLHQIISHNFILNTLDIPIVCNVEIWHTYPQNYFPIWGTLRINSTSDTIRYLW